MTLEMNVAIIDNSINPSIYTPVAHWSAFLESKWRAFTAREHRFPNLDEEFTHLILTGSESSILEREQWVNEEIELTLEAIERTIPVLGSCWGHQLLAVALAGPAYVQRSECPEIGWIPVRVTEDNTLMGQKGQVYVFSSHFDEVVGLGDDFRVFASSEKCQVHAFQWGINPVWGIQSHPEMSIPDAQHYLRENVSSRYEHESLDLYRRALDSTPKDTGMIHEVMRNFLRYSESQSNNNF
ncbi:MAG: type 1 glutamine amidotransferase [Candidatus Aminicenantaceae bacterium]